ncbi:MAG: ribonuclease HI [Candidatus Paceibacterota bacterium]|jgi:ribonuclease HI
MKTIIYTDGSSRGNPGPGGWGSVVCDGERVIELGGRESRTTNNRMEIVAAIGALEWMQGNSASRSGITVRSDSKYVVQGITAWVFGWQRNGWITAGKKEVENRDLWERLVTATRGLSIEWNRVDGHAGVPGNERCDEIATGFADNQSPSLYDGVASSYTIDLSVRASVTGTEKKKKSSSSSIRAYSYLSLVDGRLEKHKTWAECEARVKGVRGTKFKKSVSADDERDIARSWGF